MPATLDGELTPGHPNGSEKHIFVDSKSPLDRITDELPQFEEYAPSRSECYIKEGTRCCLTMRSNRPPAGSTGRFSSVLRASEAVVPKLTGL